MTFLLFVAALGLLWLARWAWRHERTVWTTDDDTAYEVLVEAHREGRW